MSRVAALQDWARAVQPAFRAGRRAAKVIREDTKSDFSRHCHHAHHSTRRYATGGNGTGGHAAARRGPVKLSVVDSGPAVGR